MNQPISPQADMTSSVGAYLTFALADETYGVEILRVREIIGMLPATRLPGSPPEVIGVVNLRGRVIPVISLRQRFGLPPAEAHPHNVTIVIEDGATRIGLAVDRVKDVARFALDDLEAPPSYGMSVDAGFVRAIGKHQGKVSILLDANRVVSALAAITTSPKATP